ncbi:MAG: hypothetical protein LBG67_00150 [Campylobacteraceae bacterium]|jgi:hypothetical protein|nr:hypothetical protein [Campylobacteraceae bacterium]
MSEELKTDQPKTKKTKESSGIEDFNFLANQFFGRNWKFIFYGLMITLLFGVWSINKISNKIHELEKTVEDNNGKVVLLTTDGRVVRITKEPLKAEYFKQYAVSIFVNNFIVDRSRITNNFSTKQFKSANDVLANSKNLNLVYNEFINKENAQSVGYFGSYLNWLLNAIGQDTLPEYISITDYSVNKYEHNGKNFKITIDIKVAAQSFMLAQNKYIQQSGSVLIEGEGEFDFAQATDTNPFGMKINGFTIRMVTKDNRR